MRNIFLLPMLPSPIVAGVSIWSQGLNMGRTIGPAKAHVGAARTAAGFNAGAWRDWGGKLVPFNFPR